MDEQTFEAQARGFLERFSPLRAPMVRRWGEGSDRHFRVHKEGGPAADLQAMCAAQIWRARKFDAGFGWIAGPPELGGRGLSLSHELLFRDLESEYDVPDQTCFLISLGMVAPTILQSGSRHLRERYLRRMYRGELIGCQLFSEPGAGSDLAALRTRATRRADHWVISGQKVWTTLAQYSDIGEILCRTEPAAERYKGMTAFIVDMKAPGVTVKPIRQITDTASFNEVFFDDVVVPDDHMLGEVNDGWRVAVGTLMNERSNIGNNAAGGGSYVDVHWLAEMIRNHGLAGDSEMRRALARLHVNIQAAKACADQATARLRSGQDPGPAGSIGKLALSRNLIDAASFLTNVLGARLFVDSGAWGTFVFNDLVLGVPGLRVAGGSDEIMKNILAERVLGLPRG